MIIKIQADFNGIFGNLLCISHSDTAQDENGAAILLREGQELLAFDTDEEDGEPCFLVARGRAIRSPVSVPHDSKWCLQINAQGIRHVKTLADALH
jgi:hypothetical protein